MANSMRTANQSSELAEWAEQLPSQVSVDPNSIDLLQVALRRKALLALGVFVGIGLAMLYYARAEPIYESQAQLMIAEKAAPVRSQSIDQGMLGYTRKAEDHAIALTSQFNLARVLLDPEIKILPTISGNEDALEDIHEGLQALPMEEGSEIIAISFKGPSPEDCPDVLKAVMDSYIEFLNAQHKSEGEGAVKFFKENTLAVKADLDRVLTEFEDWQRTKSRLTFKGNEATNIHQERRDKYDQMQLDAEVELGTVASRIDMIKGALDLDMNEEAVYIMAVQNDPNFAATIRTDQMEIEDRREEFQRELRQENTILPLRMRDSELAEKFGPDHPRRKVLAAEIEMAENFLRQQDAELTRSVDVSRMSTREQLAAYVMALEEKMKTVKRDITFYENTKNKEEELAKEIAEDSYEFENYQRQIKQLDDQYTASLQMLKEVNLTEDFGGDNRLIIQQLQAPAIGKKVAPSLVKTLAAGSMLGLMAGFGLGYLVEVTDKTFRSPQEVGETLRLPLIGHIPEIEEVPVLEGSRLAPVLVAAHKPKSPLAENFRAIRTALYFSTRGQDHRLIQTTSPVPGDGKSTLTANLAISIAQSSKRVLLLDADFRRPTQHKLFGLDMRIGLASVVDGQVDPADAIQQTDVPNLFVMPCGPRPHNPAELLTSAHFADLLEMLRGQYDFVLVDTPPLLAVTDPGVVSARVDGVILALRIRKNGRPGTIRARNILEELGANVLGVVVNGVDGKDGAYSYYSNFRNGYNYGYNYVYGQESPTGQAIGKYYDEDAEKPVRVGADQGAGA